MLLHFQISLKIRTMKHQHRKNLSWLRLGLHRVHVLPAKCPNVKMMTAHRALCSQFGISPQPSEVPECEDDDSSQGIVQPNWNQSATQI
mmetsp:Transcript_65526/g.119508  ORF Transcript_65526/g.119508 Transcript_65526/m.119508 type:complete len:89 (+) Transcript_65526:1004-1270(+)